MAESETFEPINRQEIDKYFMELNERIYQGAREYGNKSFGKSQVDLIRETQEEILDIAGWSYILWAKLERMKDKL